MVVTDVCKMLCFYPPVFRTFDKDNDGFVSVKEWIEGLSVFLRGTVDEQIQCTHPPDTQNENLIRFQTNDPPCCSDSFQVYDLNGDGYISAEEMLYLLKDCLNEQPSDEDPDEGIRDLVEITLSNMVRT